MWSLFYIVLGSRPVSGLLCWVSPIFAEILEASHSYPTQNECSISDQRCPRTSDSTTCFRPYQQQGALEACVWSALVHAPPPDSPDASDLSLGAPTTVRGTALLSGANAEGCTPTSTDRQYSPTVRVSYQRFPLFSAFFENNSTVVVQVSIIV